MQAFNKYNDKQLFLKWMTKYFFIIWSYILEINIALS